MDGLTLSPEKGCPSGLAPASAETAAPDPAAFVRQAADGGAALELLVAGARCAGCIRKIEGGLAALSGVRAARLNLSTGKLSVAFDPRRVSPRSVTETLASLGYDARPFDPEAAQADTDAEGRTLLRALAVAGFAAANVMLLSVSVWAGHQGEMGAGTRGLLHLISGLIAVPAALYAGRPFFTSALAALRRGQANMDTPISLGVLLALGLSVYETAAGGAHAYFDASVSLLFFLLIGRYLDHLARGRARAAARALLALQAGAASRIGPDGAVTSVAARAISPGDRLLLAPGDRAPVDVEIEQGRSEADRSLATGESAPVLVGPGDRLHSGAVNLTSRLVVRALSRAEDSFLAELTRLVEAGEQAKTRFVRLADRAARLYVPFVHGAAALTAAGWLLAGAEPRVAISNAIALLIITCPCALGLAVPAVQVVATGRLFRAGVLVKTGDALERLASADHAVFDKTGTLTTGRLALAAPLDPATLETAARLARASRHPIARALAWAAGPGPVAADVAEAPGEGLSGRVEGVRVRLGRASFVGVAAGSSAAEDGGPEAWLAIGDRAPIRLAFTDAARPGAGETLAALAERGFGLEMLTGDRTAAAQSLAGAVGLATWRAEVSPAEKSARLAELARQGRRALMVGDGLNDAPALAGAHVSISPGTAAEASQHAADFVLQGESLKGAVEAVDVARAARRRIMENFAFAALYNVLAAPLAAAGLVTPLIAAIAMSSSSLIVTANALRLARGRP